MQSPNIYGRVNGRTNFFSNAVKELQQCYVCREKFDHAGNKIDNWPPEPNCFNLVGDEYLEECDPEDNSCETVLSADWFLDGTQVYTFSRRCKRGGNNDYTNCIEGASSTNQYKDCYNVCTGNGCNNNLDVVNAHSKLDENGDPIEIR